MKSFQYLQIHTLAILKVIFFLMIIYTNVNISNKNLLDLYFIIYIEFIHTLLILLNK